MNFVTNIFFNEATAGQLKAARQARDVLNQLPRAYWPLAKRLIRGNRETYQEFLYPERALAARRGSRVPFLQRIRTEFLLQQHMIVAAFNRRHQLRELDKRLASDPIDPRRQQRPILAWFGCSDSRFRAERLTQGAIGSVLVGRNVGGQIAQSGDAQTLSKDAREFIVLAETMAIPTLIVATHGRCACVQHAAAPFCSVPAAPDAREQDIVLSDLHADMGHVVAAVAANGVPYYLAVAGNPPIDENDKRFFALELAHCLHNRSLAQTYINERLTPPGAKPVMDVVAVHTDQRTLTTYLYNPESERFVALPSMYAAPRVNQAPAPQP